MEEMRVQIEAREPTDDEIRAFWFTLPIDTEQVEELLGIDVDTDYYYITGKELPFADEVQEDTTVEKLNDLYSTYERINTVSPRNLLKIVLYSYMNGDYSSRCMEQNCKRDINFMYLLEGASVPDHATFARFRSLHFSPCAKHLLTQCTELLFELGEIS